jgi:sugar lactone lactonase YvrE
MTLPAYLSRICLRSVVVALVVLIASCNSGNGGDSRQFNTLGGKISVQLANVPPGAVTGLVLSDGTEFFAVTLPGGQTAATIDFTFPTAMSQGTGWSVTVVSSPPGMGCVAGNNSGTMETSPITTVEITCTDTSFYLSGHVQLNLTNPLTSDVSLAISDGNEPTSVTLTTTANSFPFQFKTPISAGTSYNVMVPVNPLYLTCSASDNSGVIRSANITGIVVTCSDNAFLLSGRVNLNLANPYTGAIDLLLTDGDELISANISAGDTSGSFAFKTPIATGTKYSVGLQTDAAATPINPPGLVCTPSNSTGTVGQSNITDILVSCADQSYPVGVSVTGLQISGTVELKDNADTVMVTQSALAAGAANFPTQLAYDSPYEIRIAATSLVQCTLANGRGIVRGPVTSAAVTCSLPQLAVLAGPKSTSAVYENSGTDPSLATLDFPVGVAVDSRGNVYVADSQSEIRKITPNGIVSTLAGSSPCSGQVDGMGAAACFNSPQAVAVDGAGNVYVADTGNSAIRKITPAGVVTTLGPAAQPRFNSPAGVAVDAAGNVYVADTFNNQIRKISPAGFVTTLAGSVAAGSADGMGTAARFNAPGGVVVDSGGNVFVADSNNGKVRKVTPAGLVTTLAASTTFVFPINTPNTGTVFGTGIAVDQEGGVYVTETCAIRKISANQAVSTLAGSGVNGSADGIGRTASFSFPSQISLDAKGDLYVADSGNNGIRVVTPAGVVTTLLDSPVLLSGAADGVGTAATFAGPAGLAFDAGGSVYVADSGNNEIRKISSAGVVTTLAGSGASGAADGAGTAASFNAPTGIAVDSAGNIYVADSGNNEIRKITPAGVVSTFAGSTTPGSANGTGRAAQFTSPNGIAFDNIGNLYVADTGNHDIRKISPDGVVSTLAGSPTNPGSDNGTGTAASFIWPPSVAVDSSGNVYVADRIDSEIRKITPQGVVTTFAGSTASGSADGTGAAAGFNEPQGIAVDFMDNVYVADTSNFEIRKITPAGVVTTLAGSLAAPHYATGSLPGQVGYVQWIALSRPDANGNFNLAISVDSAVAQVTNVNVYTH